MAILSGDVMAPGAGMLNSRFGSYMLNPYLLGLGYAGTPAPVPGLPSPAPLSPVPTGGTGGGAGGTVPPGGTQQPGQGSGPGGIGNAGGASSAAGAGAAADLAGHPGNAAGANGAPGMVGAATPWDLGYLDLGGVGSGLLSAASTVTPFPYGLIPAALQAGGRAYNTSNTDAIRSQQGIPGLDVGQWIGSVLGLNQYGNLDASNATVANPSQYGQFQTALDSKQLAGAGAVADLFKANALGVPTAETSMGNPYQDGPGGLIGNFLSLLGLGGDTSPAASVQTTNDQLSGDEAAKELASTSGLTLDQARAVLAAMQQGLPGSTALAPDLPGAADAGVLNTNNPGSTTLVNPNTGQISYQGGTGSTAQNNPAGSFSGTTAGGTLGTDGSIGTPYGVSTPPTGLNQGMLDTAATQLAANQAAAAAPAGPPVKGAIMKDGSWQVYDGKTQSWVKVAADGSKQNSNNGNQSNGALANNAPSNLGPGTMSNPGGGTTAPGSAGTGGLNNGFGGGGYAQGGYVGSPEANRPWKDRAQSRPTGSGSMLWDPTTGWTIDLMIPHDPIAPDPQQDRSAIKLAPRKASFAAGGMIPGPITPAIDDAWIKADQREFVVNRAAAKAAGPKLLGMLNTPAGARRLRGMLG